ncbi:MAG: hypothetical protein J6S63_08995 [Atopobiaceae bacterium]|nr:hypothetical protein [Atopobiaceae bacterium]
MGNIVIPGAKSEAHIRDNIDIFDFELTEEEMAQVSLVNRNTPYVTHKEEDMGRYLTWQLDIEGLFYARLEYSQRPPTRCRY